MTGSEVLTGLVASIVTELSKFFPGLNGNPLVKAVVSIVVVLAGTFIMNGKFDLVSFANTLLASFASYKIVVQPVAGATGLKTQ